ncbi:MAG: hypothetical protein KGZ51_03925 [Erysipelothrix sp.]|jgi:hypothetical protein|nr:hypothetical protein [Erysipelothrix sp.]
MNIHNKNNKFKKFLSLNRLFSVALILVLVLSGCTQGISQKEFDDLRTSYQALQQKLDNIFVLGTCSGYFVATIRGFSQDYVSDEEDKVAIVTEFQSAPFMIVLSSEQLQTLEIGKVYVFNTESKDVTLISDEFMKQTTNIQQLLLQYQLVVTSISLATESQSGLNGSTLSCTPKE